MGFYVDGDVRTLFSTFGMLFVRFLSMKPFNVLGYRSRLTLPILPMVPRDTSPISPRFTPKFVF